MSKEQINNGVIALEVVKMAQLHIKLIAFKIFKDRIPRLNDANLRAHFYNLGSLMGLCIIEENLACGYESGYFSSGISTIISSAIKILLKKIRPQAIPLVELMYSPDIVLPSAIGNSYGDIYETHFEWARDSRLNNEKEGSIIPGFKETILPIL